MEVTFFLDGLCQPPSKPLASAMAKRITLRNGSVSTALIRTTSYRPVPRQTRTAQVLQAPITHPGSNGTHTTRLGYPFQPSNQATWWRRRFGTPPRRHPGTPPSPTTHLINPLRTRLPHRRARPTLAILRSGSRNGRGLAGVSQI